MYCSEAPGRAVAFADTEVAVEAGRPASAGRPEIGVEAVVGVGAVVGTWVEAAAFEPVVVQLERVSQVFQAVPEYLSALLPAYYFHMSHKILTLQVRLYHTSDRTYLYPPFNHSAEWL